MPRVQVSTRVAATPKEVTRVLLDADRAPAWTTGLDRLELVSGVPGEAGCVGRAHYREGGRRYVLDDVLDEAQPARRYVSRVRGAGVTARVETLLEPTGTGATDLTLRWHGRGTTPLTWLVLPLARRRVAERAQADLDALRRLVEAGG